MTKKPKTVHVGNIEVTPITAKERKKLNERLKKRYDKLRRRYKEVRGKRVDWISYNYEEGFLYVGIRFMDGTYFSLDFSAQIVTDGIEFSDMSSGDEKILKTYYRNREND